MLSRSVAVTVEALAGPSERVVLSDVGAALSRTSASDGSSPVTVKTPVFSGLVGRSTAFKSLRTSCRSVFFSASSAAATGSAAFLK